MGTGYCVKNLLNNCLNSTKITKQAGANSSTRLFCYFKLLVKLKDSHEPAVTHPDQSMLARRNSLSGTLRFLGNSLLSGSGVVTMIIFSRLCKIFSPVGQKFFLAEGILGADCPRSLQYIYPGSFDEALLIIGI